MNETLAGIIGLLLLTLVPIVISFFLFRRTPHGSGDIIIALRNFIILLMILGGPGFLAAVGLFFKIYILAVIGVLLYVIPISIFQLHGDIQFLSAVFKLLDSIIPGGRDENQF
ncbi:MAG: hypothetical protein KAR65_11740 [Anaerolineales bacterium]|nr:hypothetical protein [Anaerolineales bacterium]